MVDVKSNSEVCWLQRMHVISADIGNYGLATEVYLGCMSVGKKQIEYAACRGTEKVVQVRFHSILSFWIFFLLVSWVDYSYMKKIHNTKRLLL